MSIWKYSNKFSPLVSSKYQLTLGEGDTPVDKVAYVLRKSHQPYTNGVDKEIMGVAEVGTKGLITIHFKREDRNPTGSMKDRGLSYQISTHYSEGKKIFAISSSGNAAVSASTICEKAGLKLHVFLSEKAPSKKVSEVKERNNVILHISKRPKSDAIKFIRQEGITLLRGSTDKYGTEGYKTIAFELAQQVPDATDIFIPCSSGTAFVGIYQGYRQLKGFGSDEIVSKKQRDKVENNFKDEVRSKSEGKTKSDILEKGEEESTHLFVIPRFHCVQTTRVCPVAKKYDADFQSTDISIAKAIVDRVCHRRNEIKKIIEDTGGTGWVISDQQIRVAQSEMKSLGVNYSGSSEGAMGFAALRKALFRVSDSLTGGVTYEKITKPVCLISG